MLLFSFTYSSCKNKRIDNKSFVVVRDKDNNIISEVNYVNDSILHGLAKYYYISPINTLKEEIEYSFGMMDGIYKFYRKDGTLESKTTFKRNLANGESCWFYENRKLKSKSFWINGKQYGGTELYDINGKVKLYYTVDYFGEKFFSIDYDSIGNKLGEKGKTFSENFVVFYESDTNQTPVSENFVLKNKKTLTKITVAQPPNTRTVIKMGELNKNKLIQLEINNNTVYYPSLYNYSGKVAIVTVGELRDLKGNLLKYDSVVNNIIVR